MSYIQRHSIRVITSDFGSEDLGASPGGAIVSGVV